MSRFASVAPAPDPARESADLAVARRLLGQEIAGLEALSGSLGDGFSEAVTRLAATTGRVVVSGMGKSGHVGGKIAATLASTGTPAQFVHPAEASHGDLGMIVPGDAVLALSNSGETPELADLVAHSRRFRITLIAITGRHGNSLAEAADVALVLPPLEEACPLGLAPTTSTTAMLALGDALAVTLLRRRGFSADEFRQLHPGGKLGARLLRVSEVMHGGREMPLIGFGAAMSDALLEMTAKRFGCLGIVDADGRLAGIVTDGDLRRHMGPDLMAWRVEAVMTPDPVTIRPQALASEALSEMNGRKITNLFAVDDARRPVGILHIHDCLRAGVA